MISETLAGTHAGVSEVTLSDTSSSKPIPTNGASAENRDEFPADGVRAVAAGAPTADQPRQGWWTRRTVESAATSAPLTQIGVLGVRPPVKTTAADVADGGHATIVFATPPPPGDCQPDFNDQVVVHPPEAATSAAPSAGGF